MKRTTTKEQEHLPGGAPCVREIIVARRVESPEHMNHGGSHVHLNQEPETTKATHLERINDA